MMNKNTNSQMQIANQLVETHIWCKWFLWWRRIILFQSLLFSVCDIMYTAVFGSKLCRLPTRQHPSCFCTDVTQQTAFSLCNLRH